MKSSVNLSKYNNNWFKPGKNALIRLCWYCVNAIFFDSYLLPVSKLKVWLLRIFGAQIGQGVVIKPKVHIKYPWNLKIGDYSWIGERVWIDNLTQINIGQHVCISQNAYLLTGNHNFKSKYFDLIVKPIEIENGVWIGANCIVIPGTVCLSHSVLSAGSVSPSKMEAYKIYRGNPAVIIKEREITES